MEIAERTRRIEETLERLGVVIRREALPIESSISGGLCTLRGKPTLFLGEGASPAERLAILVTALRHLDTGDVYLPPAIRALIDEPV